MLVRVEIPVDASGIDALLRRSFPSGDEAELVHQLREDGLITLGIVATDDNGEVIGYAAFSPVTFLDEDRQWVSLAPLAVDEAFRRQGVAQALVYEGLDTLNEFGYAAVFTLGDPHYYARFGFVPAIEHQLTCRWHGSEEAFQVYPLMESALESLAGEVEYSAPFKRFSQQMF